MKQKLQEIESLKQIIKELDNPYLKYHSRRFEEIVNFVKNNYSEDKKILDIGNSPFAKILSQLFSCQVDELGFEKDSVKTFGHQYRFDLNDSYDKNDWRTDIGTYDIIIFTEVIEHLYTSPNHVLSYLYSILKDNGKLILQTPNAVVLHKRMQLILGKNPYMLIRDNKFNPGHFREYTKAELIGYAQQSGFIVDKTYYGNYFDYQYSFDQSNKGKVHKYLKIINFIYAIMPPSFRPGITMVLSKK